MIQQINLYKIERKEVDTRIRFDQVFSGFWIYLGFLALMSMHNIYGLIMDRKDLYTLAKAQSSEETQLKYMTDLVEKRKASDKMVEELLFYKNSNKEKEELLANLSMSDNVAIASYSNYFESLAKRKIEGLWLNKFVVKDNGDYLFLSGQCLSPELITKFVASLSSEHAFSGKTFSVFNLSLNEKTKKFSFNIETKRESS